jgi:hypothetical protein
LLYTFYQTADESIIDMYAAELAGFDDAVRLNTRDAADVSDFLKEFHTASLLQMRGDLDGLLAIKHAELPDSPSGLQLLYYFWSGNGILATQQVGNRAEEALLTARRVLDARSEKANVDSPFVALYAYATIRADAALGNEEEVQQMRQSLLEQDNSQLFGRFRAPFIALSVVDLDAAVRRLLEHKAEHPTFHFTDWIAAHHVLNRDVLVHPDMQAFYLAEGKWIDYLAARVPEYAEYGR